MRSHIKSVKRDICALAHLVIPKRTMNSIWRRADVSRDDYVLLIDVSFPVPLICELPAYLDIDLTTNSFISLFTKNNALNFAPVSVQVPKVRFSVSFALEI